MDHREDRMNIPSYSKIRALGHAEIRDITNYPVDIQEKVDGSQFSFGMLDGKLKIRSRGKEIYPDAPPKLFELAVDTVIQLAGAGMLAPDAIYRSEAVTSPRHNVLRYDRIPRGGLVLFDIDNGLGAFWDRREGLTEEANRLDLEVVPYLDRKYIAHPDQVFDYMNIESFLGGPTIEGVVLKPVEPIFGKDGKALMGKYVSEKFKEVAGKKGGKSTFKGQDMILDFIGNNLTTEARWAKAVQHLDEQGLIEHDPRDIGKLIGEISKDVLEEEEDYIKDELFKWAKKRIPRMVIRGFPEWYKERLLERQFGND
jgi:hypothetical protein